MNINIMAITGVYEGTTIGVRSLNPYWAVGRRRDKQVPTLFLTDFYGSSACGEDEDAHCILTNSEKNPKHHGFKTSEAT